VEAQTAPDSPTQIVRLKNSFEAFGMVIDLLSHHEPFRHYQADLLAGAVRLQLLRETHVAALQDGKLLGYFGWLRTTRAIAAAWADGNGPLTPVPPQDSDAVAVTIVVAADPKVLRHLVRLARQLHPQTTVFFKRQQGNNTRKSVVTSVVFEPDRSL